MLTGAKLDERGGRLRSVFLGRHPEPSHHVLSSRFRSAELEK